MKYLTSKLPRLIEIADLTILPMKATALDLLAAESIIDLLKKGNRQSQAMIVHNLIKPNITLTIDILNSLESYNIKVANTQISYLVVFTRSVFTQRSEIE